MNMNEDHRILALAEEGTTLILSVSPDKIHIEMVEVDENRDFVIAAWPVDLSLEPDAAPCIALWVENGEIHGKRVLDHFTFIDELAEAGGSITNMR